LQRFVIRHRPAKMIRSFCLICFLLSLQAASGQAATNGVITNAYDVLSLPGASAWGKTVIIRGVVTSAEAITAIKPDWEGKFFVQDDTAGIFCEDANHHRPALGDLVEVTGTSHPGGYAPFISYASWKKLGTSPLPAAKPVTIEQLMSGNEDSQRVEITGDIRTAQAANPIVVYEIASGGYRLTVYAPPLDGINLQTMIGAHVRLRGTACTFYSGQLRRLITVELHVPFASDFILEKMQTANPFDAPPQALNSLGQYKINRDLGERVHVKGTVIYQRPGEDFFLEDDTGGLQVKTHQATTLHPGDAVDVVGFPGFDRFLPVLEDATFHVSPEPGQAVKPKVTGIRQLNGGFRHASLIRIQGKVVNRTEQSVARGKGDEVAQQTVLTLQDAGIMFTIESTAPEINRALNQIEVGSVIEADGVCFSRITENGNLQSLQILLPAADGIRILKKPDWLTTERLMGGLASLFIILVVALTWIIMVQKRNRALKNLVREKKQAQEELQVSHDLLEQRVEERTKQLKVEMSARKEAEIQFKATLAERTRLARELHDTLEQVLTGIGLQVDIAGEVVETDPASGKRHIKLVRNLMTQTQLELRRSIWDLRSRELEQFDFPNALRINAHRVTDGANLKLEIATTGRQRLLSEVTEENLLRISQAAITNIVKHAQASDINILLHFGEREVTLRIQDNGQGFDPQKASGATEGHFGLLGISERVKRLNGSMKITSEPERGSCLEVQVPINMDKTTVSDTTEQAP
jgi:signal transduction histidine kinase